MTKPKDKEFVRQVHNKGRKGEPIYQKEALKLFEIMKQAMIDKYKLQ